MQDFEKLGAFYLGKRVDPATGERLEELVLYDSKDLTTHAVIIGMTGSGKTGLGIGLIEEAAIDHIPVIAIDPKGDLGNLLLTFPQLRPADFEPWVDPAAANAAGKTISQQAAATAELWKSGLAQWGQSPERIAKFRDAAELAIYTPGSSAGRAISVLREFAAPPAETATDSDTFRERVHATAMSLLTLLGIDADPLTSREHILLATILGGAWSQWRNLDLPQLIAAVQQPGFRRVGVMDLDSFYPPNDRFALAMRLNNLLAAPGFDIWTQGDPLDVDRLLFAATGRPRVSVISIAHLDDAQRMFFVTMLLGELLAWMRRQPGSPSLRAVLYMDELFGYLPPVANPPSKQLFLTLLKQARAYGLGLVLATQNPVDLDYKALSNAGTWFIGRLQTERDKERVRDGLRGAAGSENLDSRTLDATLAGLQKRRFLLHNVHDRAPQIFETRWVMSYLAGPLTREQIKLLAGANPPAGARTEAPVPPARPAQPAPAQAPPGPAAADRAARGGQRARPILQPGIRQYFLPAAAGSAVLYVPHLLVAANAQYSLARQNLHEQRELVLLFPAGEGAVAIDWDGATEVEAALDNLRDDPEPDAAFAPCPPELASASALKRLEGQFKRWLAAERPLVIYKSAALNEYSRVGESERDFRIRLQQLGNEIRDRKVAALRKRYEQQIARLQDRLLRAEQAVARESEQSRGHKLDTAISFGTAILGAVLGRKISATSAARVGTAVRKAGGLGRQAGDVKRAEAVVEDVRTKIAELEAAFDAEVAALDDAYDAQLEQLAATPIKPKSADIDVRLIGIGWAPT